MIVVANTQDYNIIIESYFSSYSYSKDNVGHRRMHCTRQSTKPQGIARASVAVVYILLTILRHLTTGHESIAQFKVSCLDLLHLASAEKKLMKKELIQGCLTTLRVTQGAARNNLYIMLTPAVQSLFAFVRLAIANNSYGYMCITRSTFSDAPQQQAKSAVFKYAQKLQQRHILFKKRSSRLA